MNIRSLNAMMETGGLKRPIGAHCMADPSPGGGGANDRVTIGLSNKKTNHVHLKLDREISAAMNLAKSGQVKEAIQALRELIHSFPKYALLYIHRGDCYRLQKDYDSAEADFRKVVALDDNNPAGYAGLGNCCNDRRNYAAAIERFNTGLNIKRDGFLLLGRGKSYLKLGQLDKAIADLSQSERLLTDPSTLCGAYGLLGSAYYKKGDYTKADYYISKVIQYEPGDAESYHARGDSRLERKYYRLAIQDYTESIRLKPDCGPAYFSRGHCFLEVERYDDALSDLKQALELSLDDAAYCYFDIGKCYFEKDKHEEGKYEEAIKWFTAAINGGCAEAYEERGRSYQELEMHDAAIADFTEALRLEPDHAWLYAIRGTSYFKLGKTEKALADFSTALRLEPGCASIYSARAHNLMEKGDFDGALQDFDEAIRLERQIPLNLYSRGLCHFKKKEYEEALKDFERCVEMNSGDWRPWFQRGAAHGMLGHSDHTERDFKRALSLAPDNEELSAAIKDFHQKISSGKPEPTKPDTVPVFLNKLKDNESKALAQRLYSEYGDRLKDALRFLLKSRDGQGNQITCNFMQQKLGGKKPEAMAKRISEELDLDLPSAEKLIKWKFLPNELAHRLSNADAAKKLTKRFEVTSGQFIATLVAHRVYHAGAGEKAVYWQAFKHLSEAFEAAKHT